jgi:hypothetical protein
LAEFVDKVEEAINNNQVATRQDLHVQELKLVKEIELIRAEIKEVELKLTKEIEQVRADLTKEIEQVRAEMKETELKLTKEIQQVELKLTKEIEQVRAELKIEIQQTKVSLLKWLIGLLLTQTITIIGVIIGLFQVLK